jgi:excisionase family DNA binding protein
VSRNPRADERPSEPVLLTVLEAADVLGIGRTTAYALIREGSWPTPVVRLGKLIKIPASPLHHFVETGHTQTTDVA